MKKKMENKSVWYLQIILTPLNSLKYKKLLKKENNMYRSKYFGVLLVLFFIQVGFKTALLKANEEQISLSEEDKQVLQSDNKEKIIEHLDKKWEAYALKPNQIKEIDKKKLILLNKTAAKNPNKDVRLHAYMRLAVFDDKEALRDVLTEYLEDINNLSYTGYYQGILLSFLRNNKIELKDDIEKTDNNKFRDSLILLSMQTNKYDNINSNIIYDSIVRNMNSEQTYKYAQAGIHVLAERNDERIHSLIKTFQKSDIKVISRGKEIYPLRRAAQIAVKTLEFTAADDKVSAIRNMMKKMKKGRDDDEIVLFFRCSRYIRKHRMKELLPDLKKLNEDPALSDTFKSTVNGCILYLEDPVTYERLGM
ncbi:MAG: hypothetical protein JXA96_03105 [Sedimentisphaerales bacterium]|nr:hypothetical protein [Sedimentisphaerales bacterium]